MMQRRPYRRGCCSKWEAGCPAAHSMPRICLQAPASSSCRQIVRMAQAPSSSTRMPTALACTSIPKPPVHHCWSGATLGMNATLLPETDDTYDLGSSTKRWQDLYLGPASLHMGVHGNEGIVSYNTGSNFLGFDPDGDGTAEFVILDSGFVGIGTVNPETEMEIIGTASGIALHAQTSLTSSGNLVVEGNTTIGGNTTILGNLTVLQGSQVAAQLLSGAHLHAQSLLTSSGQLVVEGAAVFGSTLRLNGVTYTFPTSDGSASGKVLKTNSAGQLSWSSDTDTNTTYGAGQGLTLGGTTFRLSGAFSGTSLEIIGTASGRVLHAQDLLSSSGTLAVSGYAYASKFIDRDSPDDHYMDLSNASLSLQAAGPVIASQFAASQGLAAVPSFNFYNGGGDSDTGMFRPVAGSIGFSVDANEYFRITAQGVEIFGTSSGRTLHAQDLLSVSGSLVIDEAGSVFGAGLSDCDGANNALQWNASTGQYSCATLEGGGGFVDYYVHTAGDTMTGALAIKKTSGTATGNTLVVDTKGLVYDATNKRVGVGTASPTSALDVLGTIHFKNAGYTGANVGASLYHNASGTNDYGVIMTNNAINLLSFNSDYSTYSQIVSHVADLRLGGSGATSTMTLQALTGNVGIGDTTPSTKLEVAGGITGTSLRLTSLTSCSIITTNSDGTLTCSTG